MIGPLRCLPSKQQWPEREVTSGQGSLEGILTTYLGGAVTQLAPFASSQLITGRLSCFSG